MAFFGPYMHMLLERCRPEMINVSKIIHFTCAIFEISVEYDQIKGFDKYSTLITKK